MLKPILLATLVAVNPYPTASPATQDEANSLFKSFVNSIYSRLCEKHKGFVVSPHIAIGWMHPGQAFPVVVQCKDGTEETISAPTPIP